MMQEAFGLTPSGEREKVLSWQQMAELYERYDPELWRLVYPRIYKDTERYHSPRLLAAALANCVKGVEEVCQTAGHYVQRVLPTSLENLFISAENATRYGLPLLFVAPEILEPIERTNPDPGISWIDMHLPYEAAVFMFPRGYLTHPEQGDCGIVGYSRIKRPGDSEPGAFYEMFAKRGYEGMMIGYGADTFCIWTLFCDEPGLPAMDRTIDGAVFPNIESSDFESYDKAKPRPRGLLGEMRLTDADYQFMDKALALVFRLLLLMQARPVYVESGKRVSMHKKQPGLEIWTPTVIGRNYRKVYKSGGEGTHASPRMHTRRGHFRNQAFGKGFSQRKMIWLEPTFVGGDK